MRKRKNTWLKRTLEAIFVWLAYGVFRLLGLRLSSFIAGKATRAIAPHTRISHTARHNLALAFPEKTENERDAILYDMWENLGRVVGEFPHIPRLTKKRFYRHITVEGVEYLTAAKETNKGGILFSGHFANWEIAPRCAAELGMPLSLIYRPANNKAVDRLIRWSRRHSHQGMWAKGSAGARRIAGAIKQGGFAGLLVDQKTNNGIALTFFGKKAMTAPALAEFGLRFDTLLLPAQIIRTRGTHFVARVHPPLDIRGKSAEAIMQEVNNLLESWIRERPAQWFWVHKRWVESK